MPLRLLGPPHVLVVDGDARARAEIAAMLVAEGARATQAASADEAMKRLAAHRFDAAVVDYSLPGVGGVVLIVLLRGVGNGRDLPVVVTGAMTGPASERARAHVARLPGTVFVEEPVDRHRLAIALHGLLAPA
jgi:two-component system phosphate regulon response regulator OmpR